MIEWYCSPEKIDFRITDLAAPAFSPPLPHRSQEHKYPQNTGVFPTLVKNTFQIFWSIRMTFYLLQLLFFGFYLPKEHLAVLSWEGGTVGRATLLQQARLVGITSFNIATHLSKCIIHWHTKHTSTTKQHTHTQIQLCAKNKTAADSTAWIKRNAK